MQLNKEHLISVGLAILCVSVFAVVIYAGNVPDTNISTHKTYRVPINQSIVCDKVTITLSSKWVFGTAEANQTLGYCEFKLSSKPFFFVRYWKLTENGYYIELKEEMHTP